jgi:hypothetical protein
MTHKLFGGTLHSALVHAVTEFDRKEEARAARSKRGYHNIYALAQYLKRVEDIEADIANGATVRAAILAGMSGKLCAHVLKAVGETTQTDSEEQAKGLFYVPANQS